MSSSAVDVEVRLKMRDGAAAGLKAVSQTAQQEAAKTASATERAAQKAAEATERSAVRQRSSYEKLSQAREVLGMRSERAIQREIQQTEAAYNRLKTSGTLSWQQQAAAADRVRQKVAQLTNEMGRLTTAQKAYAGVKFAAAGVAGVGAAAYTLKGPAMTAMSYDERLAHMANTAFSGQRDAAGRKMGAKTLEEAINKARRQGGGTREQAAEALDTMIASNAIPVEDALKILPMVVKQAKAAKADPNDIALMAVRAMQTFKITADELEATMSGAHIAGQKGSFELPNMSKWLPEQMAMAKQLGISGKGGFANLLAWNQAAAITAGTKDQAGTNVRDLLNELNTPHFRTFMAEQYLNRGHKIRRGNKESVTHNLDEVYLDYQSRGIDKVTATIEMMNTIFGRDKKYRELQGELKGLGEKDPRRKEILEAMAAQVQGVTTGKVFHNQQSLMALLGIAGNADIVSEVKQAALGQYQVPKDQLESRISHSVVSDTPAYKVEQAKEDTAMAQKSAMDSLTPAIGKAAEAFSDLAAKHPLLVGTTTLATTALEALAGAAGLASLAMGKGSALGSVRGVGGKVGGALGQVAAVGGAWEVGHDMIGPAVKEGVDKWVQLGTGDKNQTLGTWFFDLLNKDPLKDPAIQNLKPADPKPVDVNAKMTVGLAPGLVLQNQSMQSNGANAQINTGSYWEGAP